MRPIIGITAREFDGRTLPALGTYAPYVDAVLAAGGAPLVIPLGRDSHEWADSVVAGLDGVLFTGGEDIEPARYGAKNHPKLDVVSPQRDEVEAAIFVAAKARRLPVLGICRGLQFINVACGGTLYQDLPSECPEASAHRESAHVWYACPQSVATAPASKLRSLVSLERFPINTLHHQAIRELGRELTVVGRCIEDGVIEAIEGTGAQWLVAVQWHPEVLFNRADGAPHAALFKGFIAAAACRKGA